MLGSLLQAVLLVLGGSVSDNVGLRKMLKAEKTGGYQPKFVQFQPCVWPNRCRKEKVKVEYLAMVPFEPCVWPRCSHN